MKHGFGRSLDELAAIELQMIANVKGYDTHIAINALIVGTGDGTNVTVIINDGKYVINRIDKQVVYKTVNAAIKGIGTAIDMLIQERNRYYG